MQRYKKYAGGGGKLKIALGLATLLSGVVYAEINNGSIFDQDKVVIGADTTVGTKDNRWSVNLGPNQNTWITKATKSIQILNNATLTINATNHINYGYVFSGGNTNLHLVWTGGNIVLDFLAGGWGGTNTIRGGIYQIGNIFEINSNFDYTYRESASGLNDFRALGVSAVGSVNGAQIKLNGGVVKINAIGNETQNRGLGIFAIMGYDANDGGNNGGTVFLNAKDDGTVNNKNAVVQIKGSISTGLSFGNYSYRKSGKVYAHFTGGQSFLQGNIYSGRFGGNSKVVASFSNGATMDGDIVFLGGDYSGTSNINFSSGSVFTGDVNTLGNGDHTLGFDNGTFVGSVKKDSNPGAIQGTAYSDVATSLGTIGDGNNVILNLDNNSTWMMTANSTIANLNVNNSTINLKDSERDANNSPRTLTITNLDAGNSLVVLGTEIPSGQNLGGRGVVARLGNSTYGNDKVVIENLKSGTLQVSAKAQTTEHKSFDTTTAPVVLVSAKNVTVGAQVTGSSRLEGISNVSTQVVHQVSSDGQNGWFDVKEDISLDGLQHRWVLASYDVSANQDLVDEGGVVLSNPYRMLLIETNNLNKRMGDLRGNNYQQGAWVRLFNGMDSGEGAKNLYTNIQLGYDYAFGVKEAKNYTGVAFSTSIVDTDGNYFDGKSNTYSFAVYNSYIADSGLYVDTIAKYLYTDQKLTANGGVENNFGNHALSLGAEFGYQVYVADTKYYLEPQAELVSGLILGVKDINVGTFGGRAVMGELETVTAFNARIGLVQGYTLETEKGIKADFRVGMSYVGEYVSNATPIRLYDGLQNTHSEIGNDNKFLLSLGTTVAITDEWRTYFDAEKSFGGKRNTDYQINFGARFSFGEIVKPIPDLNKQQKPFTAPLKTEEQAQPVKQLPQQPAQPVSKQVKAQKAK